MKKIIIVAFAVFSVTFISCDKEFNTIGADLVGDEHFDFSTHDVALKAYSVATNEVQTNNLPINPLGFYNNPYFGVTKANFVSQLALSLTQPKFGTSVQIENVTLYIPYFSKVASTDADGAKTYTLDSIYGANNESKMKLSVYENGYFLNSSEGANLDVAAKYYSNMDNLIDNQKRGNDGSGNSVLNGTRLNDSPNAQENDQFYFNKSEIVVYKTKFNTTSGILEYVDANDVVLANQTDVSLRVVKDRLAPGIYLTLNKEFFKKKILEASTSNLFNTNNFRQYFKGLYFKMEQNIGEEGAMAILNFNNARLNVNYNSVDDGAVAGTDPSSKTFLLNLGTNAAGITVSLQDYNYLNSSNSNAYNTGLSNPANTYGNATFGQNERLYLKGGKGSVVYMDLFGDADVLGKDGLPYTDPITLQPGNGIPDELDLLRLKGWLINDAYLEFYVDKSAMSVNSKSQEPERLYLFDATNQKTLVDFVFDSSVSSNTKRSKVVFGGIVERDNTTDKKAVKYKIRITQLINNMLNSTNANVNKNIKLGLCVTESIAFTSSFYYKDKLLFNLATAADDIEYFPVASIMAQQGVVLHGTASTDADKKLKLTIHYTKPN